MSAYAWWEQFREVKANFDASIADIAAEMRRSEMSIVKDSKHFQEFRREIMALEESGAGLPFVFSPTEAFMLLGQLQLVLRHPMNNGPTAEFARTLALNIQERISAGGPTIALVAEQGWHEEHDIKHGEGAG